MSLYEDMSRDFLHVWEEIPAYLVCPSGQIRAVLSLDAISMDLDLGGFVGRNSMTARVLRDELPDSLTVGSIVQTDGKPHRIEKIQTRPNTPIATLTLTEQA